MFNNHKQMVQWILIILQVTTNTVRTWKIQLWLKVFCVSVVGAPLPSPHKNADLYILSVLGS